MTYHSKDWWQGYRKGVTDAGEALRQEVIKARFPTEKQTNFVVLSLAREKVMNLSFKSYRQEKKENEARKD